jgi:hypothetical protein
MRELTEILPAVESAATIRKCWGYVPPFAYLEVLHVRPTRGADGEGAMRLTAFAMTDESDDANECKPSKLVIEFDGTVYWEYDSNAQANGIRLDDLLASPPPGTMTVNVEYCFYVVCRNVRVLSCDHDPLRDSV